MNNYIIFLLLSLTSFLGCSSDNDTIDLTPAEKVVGSWEGEYLQEDFGVSTIDVRISDLTANQVVANPTYGANDKSQCNNDIFFCDEATESCVATWEFVSSSGSRFIFDELTPPGADCVPGTVTLTLTNDNTMSYNWVDIADVSNIARGTLRRK